MPHKPWKLFLSLWATSLALAIVTLLGGSFMAFDCATTLKPVR